MRPRVEKKINHHFLPQLYLKGFAESQGSPFVWVYSKGAGYNPGERRDKNNPCRTSIRIAGARKGFYALRDEKGMMDFNTYEDLLEKLEKPANPVFAKIRAQKMINESDRQILASYIVTLMKRVPRGQEKLTSLWFKAHRILNKAVDIDRIVSRTEAQVSEDTEKLVRLEEVRREYASVMKEFGAEMPRDSLLNQTVADARIAPVLCQMTWYFLIAPKGQRYLTGDNPVFYFENIGIANFGSQLSFPISTEIALVTTWQGTRREGYYPTTPPVVKQINRRTMHNAQSELYFSRNAEWVVRCFKRKKQELVPLLFQ